ncbi:MAG: ABC transporter permease subunit [Candidatus Hydrogenedentota bacterium]
MRPFLLVILAVAVGSFVVLTAWPWDAAFYFTMGGEASMVILISALVVWCFAAVFVLPAYGGTTIILERQQETFDQVFLTLISPSGIMVGKLLNTMGMYLLIMISMLPLVATLYFLVGIELGAFFVSVSILLSVAYSITCISLLCSMLARDMRRALANSVFLAIAAIGGAFWIGAYGYLIARSFSGMDPLRNVPNPMQYVYLFVPFVTAVNYAVQPYTIRTGTWVGAIGIQLGIGTVCLVLAVIVVRRIALLPLQRVREPVWKRMLKVQAARGRPAKPLSDHVNPVYAREVLWETFARTGRRYRTLFLALLIEGAVLGVLLLAGKQFSEDMMAVLWSGMLMAAVGLLAPMATATSVTREHELGNLDMLRMTPMRPYQVIVGKTLAGLRGLSPLFIAAVLLIPLVLYGEYRHMDDTMGMCLVSFVSACVFAVVGASMGILASVLTRRTTVAVVLAYLLTACAYFLFYLVVRFVVEEFSLWVFFGGHRQAFQSFFRRFDQILMLFSPLLGYTQNASMHFHRGEYITGYWLANIGICTAYSLFALWLAATIFRVKWERAQR